VLAALVVLGSGGVGVVSGQWDRRAEGTAAPSSRQPFAETITDRDVEPFDLVVQWKALTWLGEHGDPTGLYVAEQEVFTTDNDTRLSCFERTAGKRLWMTVLGQPRQPLFEPTCDGPDVFVVASGFLFCMDRQFGSERWRLKLQNVPGGKAAVAGDFVYVAGADGWLRAFNRLDQREAWFFNARAALIGYPVVVGTPTPSLVVVAADNKRLYCFSNKERQIIWQEDTAEKIAAPPTAVGRYIYLPCSDFNVYGLDAEAASPGARLKWTFRSGSQVLDSPVAVGATVYFTSFENGFYAVGRLDGKQRWWRETGVRLLSVGQKRCYILDAEHGILVCDKLTGKLEGRFPIPKTYGWVATNTYDDALYLLNRDGLLVCLRERQTPPPETTTAPAPATTP
jgi:hypothetical protein